MLSRSLCRKGENELWLIDAEGPFHSIPKLHLKRHISRMIAQLFKELLECFSHDRPLPGDRTLLSSERLEGAGIAPKKRL